MTRERSLSDETDPAAEAAGEDLGETLAAEGLARVGGSYRGGWC